MDTHPTGNVTHAPLLQTGIVLSGGGARGAFQVGALRALIPYLETRMPITVIVGSSAGALNGIVLGGWLGKGLNEAVDTLEALWRERTYRNTFRGSPSMAFFKAIQIAMLQYASPGPSATSRSIFDPTPLMSRIDQMLGLGGGLNPETRAPGLKAVGVMTTVEGAERRPLLFVSSENPVHITKESGANFEVCRVERMSAAHAFASAALPSVLPPIELNMDTQQLKLVDGGIADNIPVDPAVRLGASDVVVIDTSGKKWWNDQFDKSHDEHDYWELRAKAGSFCVRPLNSLTIYNHRGIGQILEETVGRSTRDFMQALGPTWPIFRLLRRKFGSETAYEIMSYVALHPDYIGAVIQRGYEEAKVIIDQHLALALPFNS